MCDQIHTHDNRFESIIVNRPSNTYTQGEHFDNGVISAQEWINQNLVFRKFDSDILLVFNKPIFGNLVFNDIDLVDSVLLRLTIKVFGENFVDNLKFKNIKHIDLRGNFRCVMECVNVELLDFNGVVFLAGFSGYNLDKVRIGYTIGKSKVTILDPIIINTGTYWQLINGILDAPVVTNNGIIVVSSEFDFITDVFINNNITIDNRSGSPLTHPSNVITSVSEKIGGYKNCTD